jgi:hypothetical protein
MAKTGNLLRTEADIAIDRARIARLLAMGHSEEEISEDLDLPLAAVRRDIGALKKQWRANAAADYQSVKARELAKIDMLEREYWDVWQNSKLVYSRKVETVDRGSGSSEEGGPGGQWQKVTETSTPTVGDMRALNGVQWCIRERIKIFGLEAPKNVNVLQHHLWQVEAKRNGIDADALFQQLVAEAGRALTSGEGSDDSGSDEAGDGGEIEGQFSVR